MARMPISPAVAAAFIALAGCAFDFLGGGARPGVTPVPASGFSPVPSTSSSPWGSGSQNNGTGNISLQGVSTLAGSGILGSLLNPRGVAVDAQGRVAIANTRKHSVGLMSGAGVEITVAGNGLAGWAEGTGSAAQFFNPNAVAFEASGSLLVADTDNYQVRRVFADGQVTAFAGDGRRGDTDGAAAAARFDYLAGLAIDGAGSVYVSEQNGHIIRKVSAAGVVSTFAGSGAAGGADGTGTAATFNRPTGLATDAAGNVYVADTESHKIRRISPAGEVVTVAGTGSEGDTDGAAAQATFRLPRGVAVDSLGRVFVADTGNQRIRMIGTDAKVTTVAGSTRGFADGALSDARFDEPSGLALDTQHRVYVADSNNHRIRVVVP